MVKAAECGISVKDFWEMSWKEFQIQLLAHERKEINEWQKFRFIGYMQYAMNTGDKVKRTIEQFLPLPGDKERDRGPVVKPDDLVKRMQKLYGNGNFKA